MQYPPFPEFLRQRFSPCVFCICSDKIIAENPSIHQLLLEEWSRVSTDTEKIRLIFPKLCPNMNTICTELLDFKTVYPDDDPYSFVREAYPVFRDEDIPSYQFLRARLFDVNALESYFLFDIPLAMIHFGGDVHWKCTEKLFNSLTPDKINDLSELSRIYAAAQASISKKIKATEENFHKSKKNTAAAKWYADVLLYQRKYNEATHLYRELAKSKQSGYCLLMAAISMVIGGCTGPETSDYLINAFNGSKNLNEKLIAAMLKMHIERNMYSMKWIQKAAAQHHILDPFLEEQSCNLMKEHISALKLKQTADKFESTLKCPEYATRCRWKAWNLMKGSGFDILTQNISYEIAEKVGDIDVMMKEMVRLSRVIHQPDKFGEILMRSKIEEPLLCGFVDAILLKFNPVGFPCCEPRDVNCFWPKLAQQLFGAFDRKRFFSYNVIKTLECAANEDIIFTIFVKSRCSMFPMSNISLWVTSEVPCETSKSEIELPETAELQMTVRPLEKGIVEVSGIEFDWLTIHCRCPFESPVSFTCFENSPSVKMDVYVPKTDLIVGEIIEVKVKLTNGPLALKYLAMMTTGTASFEVIEPTTEELLGQRQLEPLSASEECEIRIAVAGTKMGENQTLSIIFPFWTTDPPARYVHRTLEFNVRAAPEIPLFFVDGEVIGQSPVDCRALGFTSNIFRPELHTVKLEGRTCQLSMISEEGSFAALSLPDYCKPFMDEMHGLLFWYETGKSVVYAEVESSKLRISVLVKSLDNNIYMMSVRNIGCSTMHDIRLSVVDPQERVTFLLTGCEVKSRDKLEPGEVMTHKVRMVPLVNDAKPMIIVSGDAFAIARELSVFG